MAMKIFRSIRCITCIEVHNYHTCDTILEKNKTCIGYIRFIICHKSYLSKYLPYFTYSSALCWKRHGNVTWIWCQIRRKSQYFYQRSLYECTKSFTLRTDEIISKYLLALQYYKYSFKKKNEETLNHEWSFFVKIRQLIGIFFESFTNQRNEIISKISTIPCDASIFE